jgi:RNA polymerase primary sigma factor
MARTTRKVGTSYEMLMEEANSHPIPTPDELSALILEAQAGDSDALNRVVRSQIKLVHLIVQPYVRRGMDIGDMLQEALFMVAKAVLRYDPAKGVPFYGFYGRGVKQKMYELRMTAHPVHVPTYISNRMGAAKSAEYRLRKSLERPPTDEEVIAETNVRNPWFTMTAERLAEAIKWSKPSGRLELDAPVDADNEATFGSVLPSEGDLPGEAMIRAEATAELLAIVNTFPERDAKIIRMCYGLGAHRPMRPPEVGKALGITGERVRQIRQELLKRLRRHPVLSQFDPAA